jgi:hypothetical protein
MLLRLHEKYGLEVIGLEGTPQRDRPLDAAWFHDAGGAAARDAREDAAVRVLAEGEISSPEFMALLFPRIKVFGTEVPATVEAKLPEGNPLAFYLVSIAEKLVHQADIRKTNDLLREAKELERAKKFEEAKKKQEAGFDHLLTAHPWLRQHYTPIVKNAEPTPLGTLRQQAQGIKAKADDLGLTIPDRTRKQFDVYLSFLEARDRASDAMTAYVVGLAKAAEGKPVGMIIGAAHTERIVTLLRESGVSFALVRPDPLHPDYGQMPYEEFKHKHDRLWGRTSPGTLGKLLNTRHKSPAVIETATAKSYHSATLASILIARAARAGGQALDDLRPRLAGLPELRIDPESFELDGAEVLFRMWLKRADNKTEQEVWARVAAVEGEQRARTLEQKLMQRIADFGNDRIPPRDPPAGTEPAKDEGPGDGRRGGMVVARTGPSELAVFAEDRAAVRDIGRIGG